MSLSLEVQALSLWGLSTELPVLDLPLTSAKHRGRLTPHRAVAMLVRSCLLWAVPSNIQPEGSGISQKHVDQTFPNCS